MIKNCAEFIQLHGAILDRESITNLIKLAEKVITANFAEIDYNANMSGYHHGAKTGVLANLQEMGYQPGNET